MYGIGTGPCPLGLGGSSRSGWFRRLSALVTGVRRVCGHGVRTLSLWVCQGTLRGGLIPFGVEDGHANHREHHQRHHQWEPTQPTPPWCSRRTRVREQWGAGLDDLRRLPTWKACWCPLCWRTRSGPWNGERRGGGWLRAMGQHMGDRRQVRARAGLFRQKSTHQLVDVLRAVHSLIGEARGSVHRMCSQECHLIFCSERWVASRQSENQTAQGIGVRSGGECSAHRLFGGQVCGCADGCGGCGETLTLRLDEARDSEVENLGRLTLQHDVRWFDVPMNHAGCMGGGQA